MALLDVHAQEQTCHVEGGQEGERQPLSCIEAEIKCEIESESKAAKAPSKATAYLFPWQPVVGLLILVIIAGLFTHSDWASTNSSATSCLPTLISSTNSMGSCSEYLNESRAYSDVDEMLALQQCPRIAKTDESKRNATGDKELGLQAMFEW